MKQETLDKVTSLKEAVPQAADSIQALVTQSDATRELFSKCEIHPALHSFLNMEVLRRDIHVSIKHPFGTVLETPIYSAGNEEDMLLDSIFDEAIDDIVENGFGKCIQGKSPLGTALQKVWNKSIYQDSPFGKSPKGSYNEWADRKYGREQ